MKKICNHCVFFLMVSLGLLLNSCELNSNSISQAKEKKTETVFTHEISQGQSLPISAQLFINEQKIDLEVATTPEQQQIGLMYRHSLPDDRGMLFPFDEPILASFWMKNVNISLDMIFLKDGVVDSIAHNVPPCYKNPCPVYYSKGFVNQVIELSGGRAQELKIKPGDNLVINLLNKNTKD